MQQILAHVVAVLTALLLHAHGLVTSRFGDALHLQKSVLSSRVQLRPNFNNAAYLGDFAIGARTFTAVYDTGSQEIVSLTKKCQTSCPRAYNVYDPDQSSTYRAGNGKQTVFHYGNGAVRVRQDFESVKVGGAQSSPAASNVPIWQVLESTLQSWKYDTSFSVLVGLGMTSQVPKAPAWADKRTMLTILGISSFSICLEDDLDRTGWLSMSPQVYWSHASRFVRLPVVGDVHWAVQLTSAKLGSHSTTVCSPSCGAIIDSGTSTIALPPQALRELYPILQHIREDCSNVDSLPDLEFVLAGHTLSLPASLYVMEIDKPPGSPGLPWKCMPAFIEFHSVDERWGPVWILGLPFLRKYHTIFDRNGPALRIAEDSACNSHLGPGAVGYLAHPRANGFASNPVRVSAAIFRLPDWANSSSVFHL